MKVGRTRRILMAIIIIVPMTMMSFERTETDMEGPAFALANHNSTLEWKGMKPGGTHHGVIDVVKGTIDTDGDQVTGGSFTINMNTIICKDLTNESMNDKLVGHLKSEDFFHTEKYPEAYFNITRVEAKKSVSGEMVSNYHITGDLTIRGVTEEVTFPAYITMDGDKVYARTGEIALDRTRWNVNYQSKKVFKNLTDKFIHDEMIVSMDLQFDRS